MAKKVLNDKFALIGRRVKENRTRAGYTQLELAERAECSESTICRLENGTSMPSIQTLVIISDALNVSVNAFFVDFLPPGNDDVLQDPKIQNMVFQLCQLDKPALDTVLSIVDAYLTSLKK